MRRCTPLKTLPTPNPFLGEGAELPAQQGHRAPGRVSRKFWVKTCWGPSRGLVVLHLQCNAVREASKNPTNLRLPWPAAPLCSKSPNVLLTGNGAHHWGRGRVMACGQHIVGSGRGCAVLGCAAQELRPPAPHTTSPDLLMHLQAPPSWPTSGSAGKSCTPSCPTCPMSALLHGELEPLHLDVGWA